MELLGLRYVVFARVFWIQVSNENASQVWTWDWILSLAEEVQTFSGRKFRFYDFVYIFSKYIFISKIATAKYPHKVSRLSVGAFYASALASIRNGSTLRMLFTL